MSNTKYVPLVYYHLYGVKYMVLGIIPVGMVERQASDQDDLSCQHGDCTAPAKAIYEGIIEPGRTIRYRACSDHAPEAPPVEWLTEVVA